MGVEQRLTALHACVPAELRYLSRSNEDDKIAADESITDWKEMRDMHGNMFYFSPSTGKTTKVRLLGAAAGALRAWVVEGAGARVTDTTPCCVLLWVSRRLPCSLSR